MLITCPLPTSESVGVREIPAVLSYRVTFVLLIVPAASAWLYCTWMMVFGGTLVAPLSGFTACGVAAVVVGDPATVNCPGELDSGTLAALSADESRKT